MSHILVRKEGESQQIVVMVNEPHLGEYSTYTDHPKYSNIKYLCGGGKQVVYCTECKRVYSADPSCIAKHQNSKHNKTQLWVNEMGKLTRLLIELRAPASITENPVFRELFPDFMKSRVSLTDAYSSLAEKTRQAIKGYLSSKERVNIYIDEWTRYGLNFVGVYCSTDERDALLACGVPDDISRGSDAIGMYLKDKLLAFGIQDKIKFCSSDCASSMVKAILDLDLEWNPCCCHIINKAMEKAIGVLEGVKTIQQKVSMLHGSTKLKQFMVINGAGFLTIPTYSVTRWLSCGEMLNRLAKHKETIVSFLNSPFNVNRVWFEDEEWVLIDVLSSIITGINSELKSLESNDKGGFFYAIWVLMKIVHVYGDELTKNGFAAPAKVLKNYIISKLKKPKVHNSTMHMMIAAALNPNVDINEISNGYLEEEKNEAIRSILERIPALVRVDRTPKTFGTRCADANCNQYQLYRMLPYQGDCNPVAFWESHKHDLPDLYKIVCEYIGLYPSSGCIERTFSMAKNVLQDSYAALTKEHAEERILLYVNSDFVKEAQEIAT